MNPTDPASSSKAHRTPARKGPPWPFILILAIVTAPIVAAYLAYYTGWGVSDETVNKGVLLEPAIAVDDLLDDATPLSEALPDLTDHKWRLLIPVTQPCDQLCQQNLYTTRQVHIRLGEKSTRVERVAANLGGEAGAEYLAEIKSEHPLLEAITVPRESWDAWVAETNAPSDLAAAPYYLLVDQQGFAMMYYTADHHGNELLDDIKRVLRFSPE